MEKEKLFELFAAALTNAELLFLVKNFNGANGQVSIGSQNASLMFNILVEEAEERRKKTLYNANLI